MMDELAEARQGNHKSWFKKFYKANIKGQRFADQIPGRQRYTGLTLSSRAQPYRVVAPEGERALTAVQNAEYDPNKMLTANMRRANKTLGDVQYYIPHDKAEFDRIQADKKTKADAAKAAADALAFTNKVNQYRQLASELGVEAPTPVSSPPPPEDEEMGEPAPPPGHGWGWY